MGVQVPLLNPGVFTPCCDLDEVKLLGLLTVWNATGVYIWIVVSIWTIQYSIPDCLGTVELTRFAKLKAQVACNPSFC